MPKLREVTGRIKTKIYCQANVRWTCPWPIPLLVSTIVMNASNLIILIILTILILYISLFL